MESSMLRKRPREEQPEPLDDDHHAPLANAHSSVNGQHPSAPALAVQDYQSGLHSAKGLCGSLQAAKEGGEYGAFASSSSSDFEGAVGEAVATTPQNGPAFEDCDSRKGGVIVVKSGRVIGTLEGNRAGEGMRRDAKGPPPAGLVVSSSMEVSPCGDDNGYHLLHGDKRNSTARRTAARAASLVSTCPDLQVEDSCHSCDDIPSFGDKWPPGGDEIHDDLAAQGWSTRGWGDDQKADALSGLWVFSNQGNSRIECRNHRDDDSWLSGPTDERMKDSDCSSPSKRHSSHLCDGALGVKIGVIEEEGGDERDLSGMQADALGTFPSLQPGSDGIAVLQQECSGVAGIQIMEVEPSFCGGGDHHSSKADLDDDVISGSLSSAQESPNLLFKSSKNPRLRVSDSERNKNPSVSSRRTDGCSEGGSSRQRTSGSSAGDAKVMIGVEENEGENDRDKENSRLDPWGKEFEVVGVCDQEGKSGEGMDDGGVLMSLVKEKPSVRRPRSRLVRDRVVLSGQESDYSHASVNEVGLVAAGERVATCIDKHGHSTAHDSCDNADTRVACTSSRHNDRGKNCVAVLGHDHVAESMQFNVSALGTATRLVPAKSLGLADAAEIAASVSFMASNILALAENKESAGQNEVLFLKRMGAPGTGATGEAGKESFILGPRHPHIRAGRDGAAISAGGSNSRVSGCSSGGDNDGGGVREGEVGGVSSRSAVVALAGPAGNGAALVGRGDVSSRVVKVGTLSHEVCRLRTLARMPKHGDVVAVRSMCSRNLNLNPGIHVGDISAVLDSCSRSVSRALLKPGVSAGRGNRGAANVTVDMSDSAALSRFTAGGNGRGGGGGLKGLKSSSEAGSSLSGSNDRGVGGIQVDVHLPSSAVKGKTVLRDECSLRKQQELHKAALLVRAFKEAGEVTPMACGGILKRKNGLAGAYRLQAMESKCNNGLVVATSEGGAAVPRVDTACSAIRFRGGVAHLEGPKTVGYMGNNGTSNSHSKSAAMADPKVLAPQCEVHSTNNPGPATLRHNIDNENEQQSQHRHIHHESHDQIHYSQVAAEQTRLHNQLANSTQSSRRSRTRPLPLLERASVPIREPGAATDRQEVSPLTTGTGVAAAAATSFSEWRHQTCSRASRRSMKTLARAKGRASRFGMVDDSCMVGNSQQLSSASSSAA